MLDPDPDSMNMDPKHCFAECCSAGPGFLILALEIPVPPSPTLHSISFGSLHSSASKAWLSCKWSKLKKVYSDSSQNKGLAPSPSFIRSWDKKWVFHFYTFWSFLAVWYALIIFVWTVFKKNFEILFCYRYHLFLNLFHKIFSVWSFSLTFYLFQNRNFLYLIDLSFSGRRAEML